MAFFTPSLSVGKVLVSTDRRLIFLHYCLLLAAFTFFLIQLFAFHRYAAKDVGQPFLNTWVSRYRTKTDNFSSAMCNNNSYDYVLPSHLVQLYGPYDMRNVSCEWYDDASVIVNQGNTLGITTLVQEPYEGDYWNLTKYLVTGTEQIRLNLQHGVFHESIGTVYHPKTEIVDPNGNVLQSVPKEGFPVLSLALVEQAAGFSLEDIKPTEPVLRQYPIRQRSAGIQVTISLKCTNKVDWSWDFEVRCVLSVRPLPTVWGVMPNVVVQTAGSEKRETVSRLGVVMNVIQEVDIYQTEVNAIVSQFSSFVSMCLLAAWISTKVFDLLHDSARKDPHQALMAGATSTAVAALDPAEGNAAEPKTTGRDGNGASSPSPDSTHTAAFVVAENVAEGEEEEAQKGHEAWVSPEPPVSENVEL